MKNKLEGKKRQIVFLSIVGALVLAMVLLIVIALLGRGNTGKEGPGYILYWNVDREEYAGTVDNGGSSTRKKDSDGYYQIVFAVDGEQVSYDVEDKRLVNQIDNESLMGLGFDENGIVIEKQKVEDITGGYVVANFVVEEVTSTKIVANSSLELRGVQKELKITEDTGIYDVSGAGSFVGEASQARVGDRITAVQDQDGNVTHVFVTSRAEVLAEQVRYCQHCNSEVTWYEWTQTDTLPVSAGHWILTCDVTCKWVNGVEEDSTVVLDLNGHTADGAEGKRVYSVYQSGANLSVMDTSEGQSGVLKSHGVVGAGNVILVGTGLVELYSGTLDGSDVETTSNGGTIKILADAIFHMYGGTIVGSNVKSGLTTDMQSIQGGYGGSVYVTGDFVMDDGIIRGGKVGAYHNEEKNSYQRGFGGNVYVGKAGKFTMNGGTLQDGRSDRGGGNLRIDGQFIMTGGEIAGGTSSMSGGNGGNISASATSVIDMKGGTISGGITNAKGGNLAVSGTFNMSGGTITGGISKKDGVKDTDATHHNLLLLYGSKFNMSGGTIEGYVAAVSKDTSPTSITVSGSARICGGTKGLYMMDNMDLEVGTMTSGACIYVSRIGFFSTKTNAANAAYFYSDCDETAVLSVDGRLYAGQQHCLCGATDGKHMTGCSGEQLLWTPWTKDTSAPRSEGNWYLTKNVKLTGQMSILKDAKMNLNLNGHTIYGAENKRVYSAVKGNVTVAITDIKYNDTSGTASTGRIVVRGEKTPRGGIMQMGTNATLLLYKGKLDASSAASSDVGTAISVGSGCSLKIYGGTIAGGNAEVTSEGGGGIYAQGTVELWNGIVKNGISQKSGGNIYIGNGGSLKICGGQVSAGTAQNGGGNIYVAKNSKAVISGGIIKGGTANNGGNIAVGEAGDLTIAGGDIKTGNAFSTGGNLRVDGQVTMTDGKIRDGSSEGTAVSHNVYLASSENAGFTMTGGKIEGYFRAVGAANLKVGGTAAIWNSTKNFDGFNLYIPEGKTFALDSLKEGAKIGVTGSGIITTEDASQTAYEGKVISDSEEDVLLYSTNQLFVGKMTTAEECYCLKETVDNDGHTCETTYWSAWKSSSSLPTATGNYYLTQSVTLEELSSVKAGSTITLDLNGYTVTGKTNSNVYNANGAGITLNITDSSEEKTGQLVAMGSSSSSGRVLVFGNKEGTKVYLWAGTLVGATAVNNGGALMQNGGELRMYEGAAIQGGKANKRGDAVYIIKGETYLYGGTITGEVTLSDENNVSLSVGKSAKIVAGEDGMGLTGGHEDGAVRTAPLLVLLDGTEVLPEICISESTDGVIIFGLADDQTTEGILEEQRNKFTCPDEKQILWGTYLEKNQVTIQPSDAHIHCACGGNAEDASACGTGHWPIVYEKLESTTKAHLGGNYYLAEDITIGSVGSGYGYYDMRDASGGTGTLNLCLNGHTLTGTGNKRILYIEGAKDVNITGICAATETKNTATISEDGTQIQYGTLKKTGASNSGKTGLGGCIDIYSTTAKVRLYNVYLDGSECEYTSTSNGATLYNKDSSVVISNCLISKHPDNAKGAYNGNTGALPYISEKTNTYLYEFLLQQ